MKKHLILWCSVLLMMELIAFPNESVKSSTELTGQIVYLGKAKVYINLGTSDGIKPGMVFVVYHILESKKDPSTGEVTDEVSEPVAEISVVEVKEKASTCIVVTKLSVKHGIVIQDIVKLK